MIKNVLILLILISSSYGLTNEQKNMLIIVRDIGKTIKIGNSNLRQTIPSILLQESSAHLGLIGDDKTTKYFYKHKNKKIYINKKETFIKNNKLYFLYKKIYIKKVYIDIKYNQLDSSSLGPFQIKPSTARQVLSRMKYNKRFKLYRNLSNNRLYTLLLYDIRFSSLIAGYYIKINYDIAVKRKFKKPWFSAVSHYNGGWNNRNYIYGYYLNGKHIRGIVDRMRTLKKANLI